MRIDCSEFSGFPLFIDPEMNEISVAKPFQMHKTGRTSLQLQSVLRDPTAALPERELYTNYLFDLFPPKETELLKKHNLTYSLVYMPPSLVGKEFVKTMGHYHPPVPGTNLGFPEVYTQYFGELILLLQKVDQQKPNIVLDFSVIHLTPGVSVIIPPDYAHVLVNASSKPALMAGLYGDQTSFKPDYVPIIDNQGLAYYLIANQTEISVEPNPKYDEVPDLIWRNDLTGTVFQSLDPGIPMWSSYMNNPDQYAFLTDPNLLNQKYGSRA